MTEIDKLLVENLLEALRQIQSYLVLAFGASGSALALSLKLWRLDKAASELAPRLVPEPVPRQALKSEPKRAAESAAELNGVEVPGIPVALNPSIAQLVFLVLTCVAGLMAGYTAHSAMVIASRLRSVHGLLEAAATFPSITTSPYPAVRFIPVLLPPVLASWAVWLELRREKAAPTALWVWLTLIIVPYFLLALALHRPGWAL